MSSFFKGATGSIRLGAVAAATEEEADRGSIPTPTKEVEERLRDSFRGRDSKCNRNNRLRNSLCMQSIACCTHFDRVKKVLPFCDSQSVNRSRDSSASYRVSKAQSAPSWETPVLQKQFGEDHPGSMGVGSHTGLQNTFQSAALPAIPTKSLNSLSSRGSSHAAGDSEYARKACNRRNHTQGA